MKKKIRVTKFDPVDYLKTPADMSEYLEAALEEAPEDPAFIAKVLGDIARAKGMARVAKDAGLSRESLYKALSGERSPDFGTVLKVLKALGFEMHVAVAR